MPSKISNPGRSKTFRINTDAVGDYEEHPNGQRTYFFTTAITSGSTTTAAPAGSKAMTTHATGRDSIFRSNGTHWVYLVNA